MNAISSSSSSPSSTATFLSPSVKLLIELITKDNDAYVVKEDLSTFSLNCKSQLTGEIPNGTRTA